MIIRQISRKNERKRVAAYCRVSTQHDDQLTSYEEQVKVYTEMIRRNPEWKFVGIFADPGISGTEAERRPEFMRMIRLAQAQKLDIILCKSVSRFARNATEAQKYVEILKENHVTVIFEEQNIRTDDPSAHFLFSLMASIAQDESRSNSENVKWSIQQRFARGEYSIGSGRMLGYDCVEGKLVPNKDAWIVREVFRRFLAGESYRAISDALVAMGAKNIKGKEYFGVSTLQGMLQNETYVGDKHLQKRAPVNYLTKRPDLTVNYKTYYLENDHEAIIDRETWMRVQEEIERRKNALATGVKSVHHHPLYGRLFCGECGSFYIRRTVKSKGGAYRKIWVCKKPDCKNRKVWEDDLTQYIDAKKITVTREKLKIEGMAL